MKTVLNIYKPVGWTPLEAMNKFKELHPEYAEVKMTYAGRLDPMAEGVVIALAGEEIYKKDFYLKLDKQYEAEILIGIETDTYDALGIIQRASNAYQTAQLFQEVKRFNGSNILPVPPFSAYKVNGKPMHYWAREGKLDEMQIPKRTMNVFDLEIRELRDIHAGALLATVYEKINRVSGDFRQNAIKQSWRKHLEESERRFPVLNIYTHVTSGTYIRSIAHELGCRLGTGALLLSLKRTAVGEYTAKEAEKIDV